MGLAIEMMGMAREGMSGVRDGCDEMLERSIAARGESGEV